MPCDMGMGSDRSDYTARRVADEALTRVAKLEEAMCGLCQMIEDGKLGFWQPQLSKWFDEHKEKPGCSVKI